MEILSISELTHSGMQYERSRIELAAMKLSLMNLTFSAETEADNFLNQLLAGKSTNTGYKTAEFGLKINRIKEDSNPLADSEGHVYRFEVDPTHEMSALVSATRAYEANVRAFNANSDMNKAALEIGKN